MGTPAAAVTELADGYAALVEQAQSMLSATNQLTQRAIERLQETAAQGREKWFWLALATIGIALALAIVFAVLIARPIRQLDQAIRQARGPRPGRFPARLRAATGAHPRGGSRHTGCRSA